MEVKGKIKHFRAKSLQRGKECSENEEDEIKNELKNLVEGGQKNRKMDRYVIKQQNIIVASRRQMNGKTQFFQLFTCFIL